MDGLAEPTRTALNTLKIIDIVVPYSTLQTSTDKVR